MSKKAEREKTENTGKTGKAGKTGETGKARKTGETGKAGRTGKTVKAGETGNAGKTGETVKAGKAGKARKTGKTGRGVCIRLDKLLAREGLGTRSELGRAIRKGRVSVNGTAVKDAGLRVSEEDEILFDGKAVRQENYVYYMLHKPAGVISATEDSRAQTVLDLLRKPFPNPLPAGTQSAGAEAGEYVAEAVLKGAGKPGAESVLTGAGKPGAESVLTGAERPGAESVLTGAERPGAEAVSAENAKSEGDAVLMEAVLRRGLFPVGRLDKDTEGLLLITDDGQLAHRLLAPGKHVDKTYYAIVTGQVNDEDVQAFARGLEVDEEFTAMPARLCTDPEADTVFFGLIPRDIRAKISPEITQYSQTLVTIKEGKYHQIKRMFAARGKEVLYLKRLSMGSLILDRSLLPGQFRPLTQEELELLL